MSARTSPPASSQPPSPPTFAASEKISHKKGAGKKVKKLGNNQYTKNRDLSTQPVTSSPQSKRRQLANHTQALDSGEEQTMVNGGDSKHSPGAHENGSGSGNGTGNGKGPGKFGRGKGKAGMNGHARLDEPVERTFVNMKRSMDGMMAFMQRHQVDMAGDRTPPGSDTALPRVNVEDASLVGGAVQPPATTASESAAQAIPPEERPFDELSSMQMADVIARNIANWHTLYGHHA